jgi:hypothetical protein
VDPRIGDTDGDILNAVPLLSTFDLASRRVVA